MNMDEILTLVQAVSDSKLTSFKLDQGDMHISLKKEKEEAKIITVGAPGAVAAVPAPSAAPGTHWAGFHRRRSTCGSCRKP